MLYKNAFVRNYIRKFRYQQNLTQSDLANMCGVARNTITSIERYEYFPSIKLAILICQSLHKTFDEVFYLEFKK